MPIKAKTEHELELMRQSAALLSSVMGLISREIKTGISGLKLDKLAETFIRDHAASPSFKGYHGFPGSLCISVNDEVVHGIPNAKAYKSGDIVSVDCGVFLNGYHADMAYTFGLGEIKPEHEKLLRVTKESLYEGIRFATAQNRTGDIGFAVQQYCEILHPYKCVRELVGHGLGKTLHEDPQVPNYGSRGSGPRLIENCTIAIEPMVNLGRRDVFTRKDRWTIATSDGKVSAHFEHTVRVGLKEAEIFTSFSDIEAGLAANAELCKI